VLVRHDPNIKTHLYGTSRAHTDEWRKATSIYRYEQCELHTDQCTAPNFGAQPSSVWGHHVRGIGMSMVILVPHFNNWIYLQGLFYSKSHSPCSGFCQDSLMVLPIILLLLLIFPLYLELELSLEPLGIYEFLNNP